MSIVETTESFMTIQKVPNYFSMNLILHFYLSLSENQVYRRVPEVAE